MSARIWRAAVGKTYPYNPKKQKERFLHDRQMDLSRLKYLKKQAIRQGNQGKAENLEEMIRETQRIIRYYD